MILSREQAKQLILKPKNSKHLTAVRNHESALRLYTERLNQEEASQEYAYKALVGHMTQREPRNVERVLQFASFPLPVTSITDSILNDFYKIYEGKNRYFNISSSRDTAALQEWVLEHDIERWVQNESEKAFKNCPSTFIVLDKDEQGKPYPFVIDSSRIIDVDFEGKTNVVNYAIFTHSVREKEGNIVHNYAVYDSEKYSIFSKSDGDSEVFFVSESNHNLGFCPVRPFLTKKVNSDNPFMRASAFSLSETDLMRWTMTDIYREYVDSYSSFPIVEAPVQECKNPACRDGIEVREISGEIIKTKCGKCKGKGRKSILSAPGTVFEYVLPKSKDQADPSGKLKLHYPETDKLLYNPKKLKQLEKDIKHRTVGVNSLVEKEAINEKQVEGSFTSMESIILKKKEELDKAYSWIVSTASKLLYGNIEISIEANYGTEFYLISETELQERFDKAKKIGLPTSELVSLYIQIIKTKYKDNPEHQRRQLMLFDLNPYPVYTVSECMDLLASGIINTLDVKLKVNFERYISRFELENVDILMFGINLDYSRRVEAIKQRLEQYATNDLQQVQEGNNQL